MYFNRTNKEYLVNKGKEKAAEMKSRKGMGFEAR